jgi:hypothetical protein
MFSLFRNSQGVDVKLAQACVRTQFKPKSRLIGNRQLPINGNWLIDEQTTEHGKYTLPIRGVVDVLAYSIYFSPVMDEVKLIKARTERCMWLRDEIVVRVRTRAMWALQGTLFNLKEVKAYQRNIPLGYHMPLLERTHEEAR